VNSYKRLVLGYEAPAFVSWARNNRSAVVNVPRSKGNRAESTRVEYRAPDPACNPYLAFACILSAGLAGIEESYELPKETTANLYELSPEELVRSGVRPLPGNLHDAVEVMEGSDLVRSTLGEHVHEWFIRNKRAEWADYKTQVSQFELDRYLHRL
jgi:glutamine synthetase